MDISEVHQIFPSPSNEKEYSPEPIPKITRELINDQLIIINQKKFDEIVCIICDDIPIDPIKCKHCSVIMCKDCFNLYMNNSDSKKTCPQRCSENEMEVEIAEDEIKEIDTFVNLKCKQCQEVMVYSKYKSHLESCKERIFHCNNEGCFFKKNEEKMKEHDKDCRYKKINCKFCNILVKRKNMERHLKCECKEKIEECPKCHEKMPYFEYNGNHKSVSNNNKTCLKNQISNLENKSNFLEKNLIDEKIKNSLLEKELNSKKEQYEQCVKKNAENELNKEKKNIKKLETELRLANEKCTQLSKDVQYKEKLYEEERVKKNEWKKESNKLREENKKLIYNNEILQIKLNKKNEDNKMLENKLMELKQEFNEINLKLKIELGNNTKLKKNITTKDIKIEDLLNRLILLNEQYKKEENKNIDLVRLNQSATIKIHKDFEKKCCELNIQKTIAETQLNKTVVKLNNLYKKFKEEKYKKEIIINPSPITDNEISFENKFKYSMQKNNLLVAIFFVPLMIIGLYNKFFKNNYEFKTIREKNEKRKINLNYAD